MAFSMGVALVWAGWLAVFFACLGWGSFFNLTRPAEKVAGEEIFSRAWLGFAFLLFFLNLYHLFWPINYLASMLLIGGGLLLLYVSRKRIDLSRVRLLTAGGLPLIILFSAAALILAARAIQVPIAYDSGLYHFNSIRWLNEYAVVPGIGNLHGRLAFNQVFFSFAALLNLYPFLNYGYILANSFLVALLLAEVVFRAGRALGGFRKDQPRRSDLAGLLLLPALFYIVFWFPISSPTPDLASAVLQLLLFIRLVALFDNRNSLGFFESELAVIMVLAATAVSMKLSNAVFAGLTVLVSLGLYYWHSRRQQVDLRVLQRGLLVSAAISLLWCTRGVIGSGYPAYPSTFGRFPLSWTMPLEAVRNEARWVYSWARLPGGKPEQVLGNFDWLQPWLEMLAGDHAYYIQFHYPLTAAVVIFLLALVVAAGLRLSDTGVGRGSSLLLVLPLLGGLLFWFFSAPALRFASALLFALPVAAALVLMEQAAPLGKRLPGVFTASILIGFMVVNLHLGNFFLKSGSYIRDELARGYEPLPEVELTFKTTASGLRVWVPARGDQSWDAPLPATPWLRNNLALRGDGLQQGFFLER